MFPFMPLGSQTITVLRAPVVVDPRDHSERRNWVAATEVDITDCLVTPFELSEKLSFEMNRDREYSRTNMKVFAPPGVDILYTDRIRFNGELYVVAGKIGRWVDFEGIEDHCEFIIQEFLG